MKMMLGQTYKEKLSEWNADLPGAMQEAARLSASSAESSEGKKGWGLLELIGGAIAAGIGLALLADDKDSSPGLSLLIFGGLSFLKGVGTVLTRLLEKWTIDRAQRSPPRFAPRAFDNGARTR